MKRITETIRRRYNGQQPGTKSARGPVDKPRNNRGSIAGFVPPSVQIGFSLVVLPETRPGRFYSMVWKVSRTVVFGRTDPSASRSARRRPAPAPRSEPPCPSTPVVCPGFESTGEKSSGRQIDIDLLVINLERRALASCRSIECFLFIAGFIRKLFAFLSKIIIAFFYHGSMTFFGLILVSKVEYFVGFLELRFRKWNMRYSSIFGSEKRLCMFLRS